MNALSGGERASLERLVTRARRLLEEDLAAQASGRFGVDPDGTLAHEADLRLDPSELETRRELVEVVAHFVSEGAAPAEAVGRTLREATFTHLNRLVAIRIAECQGLLRPSLAEGRTSAGYRDLLELAPLLAADDTEGYRAYLGFCGDELAADVAVLFDPRNPVLALAPSPAALDRLVEALADPTNGALWEASDCLGWVYQFFNTAEERKAMREDSPAPLDSRELAVRNQFFTPRYVVDFLVQNTLGRRLAEIDPGSALADEMTSLLDPPAGASSEECLEDMAVLDPACGSGHFLLASYDLLEAAYKHRGVSPADAAPAVLASLWGIDIDPRCVQVASAALMLRARRSAPAMDLPRPNVICARALPAAASGMSELLEALPRNLQPFATAMVTTLDRAPVLGPLLRVGEQLTEGARGSIFGEAQVRLMRPPGGQQSLADLVSEEEVANIEEEMLAHLRSRAEATAASATERLLAAEAADAVRFVEAMRARYDAVVMNPPFGEPVPETKEYLRSQYPWMPKLTDLLAAFVGCGVELCKPGGYVGAITNRTALYIKTFEGWRRKVLLANELVCMADLGYGVMEGAMVEAAAYVVRAGAPKPDSETTFVRLLKDHDRAAALAEAVEHYRAGEPDSRVSTVEQATFSALAQAQIAYAMGPAVLELIAEGPVLEGSAGEARIGLVTGDDLQFVRAVWEVDPARIARRVEETKHGHKWVPFAKGGAYSLYWSDIHLAIDWAGDGKALRSFSGAHNLIPQYFFRPGLTWSRRTNSSSSFRVLPAGCVFADKGPGLFSDQAMGVLGWLNSRLVRLIIDATAAGGDETSSGTPSRSYEVGAIQSLPVPSRVAHDGALAGHAAALVDLVAGLDRYDETASRFVRPSLIDGQAGSLRERALRAESRRFETVVGATEHYAEADERIASLVGLDDATRTELDQVAGPLVARLADDPLTPEGQTRANALLNGSVKGVIEAAVQARGEARFIRVQHQVIDRQIELAALALGRSPRALATHAMGQGLVSSGRLADGAADLISYLMGVAFGRWDVRVAVGERHGPRPLGPFEPVPGCAPGQLTGPEGHRATEAPSGYPLALPPTGILVDEPGHPLDLVAALRAAAEAVLASDAEGLLHEAVGVLGHSTLCGYLRRGFFKDHLARYSKSRRHAPIYWPLGVPSGSWGVWLYAPRLSREALYAVVRAVTARQGAAGAEVARLRQERQVGGAGRTLREVAGALESEEALAGELKVFATEAERVARLGWEPDLDDGVVLCAAPLAGLLPAWPEPAVYRGDLKAGKYSWASVAKWADEL